MSRFSSTLDFAPPQCLAPSLTPIFRHCKPLGLSSLTCSQFVLTRSVTTAIPKLYIHLHADASQMFIFNLHFPSNSSCLFPVSTWMSDGSLKTILFKSTSWSPTSCSPLFHPCAVRISESILTFLSLTLHPSSPSTHSASTLKSFQNLTTS